MRNLFLVGGSFYFIQKTIPIVLYLLVFWQEIWATACTPDAHTPVCGLAKKVAFAEINASTID